MYASMATIQEIVAAGFSSCDDKELGQATSISGAHDSAPRSIYRFHEGVSPGDAACSAAKRALAISAKEIGEVDYVISCTQTPDRNFPGTASSLLSGLGCAGIPALELRQQGVGALYGCLVAENLVATKQAKVVLVTCAEFLSRYFSGVANDRNLSREQKIARGIFADGAAAFVVFALDRAVPQDIRAMSIEAAQFGSMHDDERSFDMECPAAYRYPRRITEEDLLLGRHLPFLHEESFRLRASDLVAKDGRRFLENATERIRNFEHLVFHAPLVELGRQLPQGIAAKAGYHDPFVSRGYSGSAGVLLALADLFDNSALSSGSYVMASTCGAGLCTANMAFRVL